MAIAKPNGWNEWTEDEKRDYVFVLGQQAKHAIIEERTFAPMSTRVKLAVKRLYESILDG
jgi:hypothetical protein